MAANMNGPGEETYQRIVTCDNKKGELNLLRLGRFGKGKCIKMISVAGVPVNPTEELITPLQFTEGTKYGAHSRSFSVIFIDNICMRNYVYPALCGPHEKNCGCSICDEPHSTKPIRFLNERKDEHEFDMFPENVKNAAKAVIDVKKSLVNVGKTLKTSLAALEKALISLRMPVQRCYYASCNAEIIQPVTCSCPYVYCSVQCQSAHWAVHSYDVPHYEETTKFWRQKQQYLTPTGTDHLLPLGPPANAVQGRSPPADLYMRPSSSNLLFPPANTAQGLGQPSPCDQRYSSGPPVPLADTAQGQGPPLQFNQGFSSGSPIPPANTGPPAACDLRSSSSGPPIPLANTAPQGQGPPALRNLRSSSMGPSIPTAETAQGQQKSDEPELQKCVMCENDAAFRCKCSQFKLCTQKKCRNSLMSIHGEKCNAAAKQ